MTLKDTYESSVAKGNKTIGEVMYEMSDYNLKLLFDACLTTFRGKELSDYKKNKIQKAMKNMTADERIAFQFFVGYVNDARIYYKMKCGNRKEK